jgi:molybdate-binding protein
LRGATNLDTSLMSLDVAGRVASGELAAGESLPSVREAARRYGTTTTTVARAYRCLADAGLGVRAAATALDLSFTPVTWEDFDIVLSADTLAAAWPLIAALRDPAAQASAHALGGYDLAGSGTVKLLG